MQFGMLLGRHIYTLPPGASLATLLPTAPLDPPMFKYRFPFEKTSYRYVTFILKQQRIIDASVVCQLVNGRLPKSVRIIRLNTSVLLIVKNSVTYNYYL